MKFGENVKAQAAEKRPTYISARGAGEPLHPRRSIHVPPPPPQSRLTKTPPLTVRIAPKMILGVTRSNFRRKMADMPMTRRGEV